MEGRAPFLAALTLVVAISACQSTPVPTSTGAPPPPEPTATLDASACQQRIAAVDLTKDSTIVDVSGCRFTPGGESAARQVLAGGGTGDQLWAATWVYGSSGRDPAPLLPLARQADPSIRAMAGAALAALGERAGLEALTSSLDQSAFLAGSSPPISIQNFAVFNLSRFVLGPGAPSSASPAPSGPDAPSAWRSWLTQNAATLIFDPDTGAWSAP